MSQPTIVDDLLPHEISVTEVTIDPAYGLEDLQAEDRTLSVSDAMIVR